MNHNTVYRFSIKEQVEIFNIVENLSSKKNFLKEIANRIAIEKIVLERDIIEKFRDYVVKLFKATNTDLGNLYVELFTNERYVT